MALPTFIVKRENAHTVKTVSYKTPLWLFEKLNRYYHFYTDPCTLPENPLKTPLFFTRETNGLDFRKWLGNVYINPPYFRADLDAWSRQAQLYSLFNEHNTVVMLVPAKTEQMWFQVLLSRKNVKFYFIKNRLRFEGTHHSATFSSMLIFFNDKIFDTGDTKIIIDNVFDKDSE